MRSILQWFKDPRNRERARQADVREAIAINELRVLTIEILLGQAKEHRQEVQRLVAQGADPKDLIVVDEAVASIEASLTGARKSLEAMRQLL